MSLKWLTIIYSIYLDILWYESVTLSWTDLFDLKSTFYLLEKALCCSLFVWKANKEVTWFIDWLISVLTENIPSFKHCDPPAPQRLHCLQWFDWKMWKPSLELRHLQVLADGLGGEDYEMFGRTASVKLCVYTCLFTHVYTCKMCLHMLELLVLQNVAQLKGRLKCLWHQTYVINMTVFLER